MTIMTVDGKLPRERHTSLVHVVACAAGAVAVPIQTAPPQQDNQRTTSSTLQASGTCQPE
jgi:hypothetical protein